MAESASVKKPVSESLARFCADKLAQLEARHLRRHLVITDRKSDAHAYQYQKDVAGRQADATGKDATGRQNDTDLISFACNDYLGLSHHADVIAAARQATTEHGTGAGASRLITGNHPLFQAVEKSLAALKQSEDCVVFGSGYLANIGTIPALMRGGDLILADALAHACIHAGAKLSAATVIPFAHNDMADLDAQLARHRKQHKHCLIVTDGVFSMDGDLAPLPDLRHLADRHEAWLMVDDAHAIGVVGKGRGSAQVFSPPPVIDINMGTLSKAVGSYGGYICGSHILCEFLRNRARSFVYSTGLPPASMAAALAALDIIHKDRELTARPLALAARFCRQMGLPSPQSAIVPLILQSSKTALAAAAHLHEAGFLVTAIRPPTVPENTARLRFAFSALHKEADIDRLAATTKAIMADMGITL